LIEITRKILLIVLFNIFGPKNPLVFKTYEPPFFVFQYFSTNFLSDHTDVFSTLHT